MSTAEELRRAFGTLIHEAAKLARREHSQADDHAIDQQAVSAMAIKRSAEALREANDQAAAELDRLRADHLKIAQALGIVYEADGLDPWPGPLSHMLAEIESLQGYRTRAIEQALEHPR